MIRLILLRHGNTFEAGQTPVQVGCRTDLPLTLRGREQASIMAKYLVNEKISPKAIYAGDLLRQKESAKIISERYQLPVFHEPALTEIDYGPWEGLTSDAIQNQWPNEYAGWAEGKWQRSIFGGCLEEKMEALQNWLNSLRQAHGEGEAVLGITSNGLLRLFRNEKVSTGHFCEIHLFKNDYSIQRWNVDPATK